MNGRAYRPVIALLLASIPGCDDRSTVLDFSPTSLVVATGPAITPSSMVPHDSMGSSGPASELFFASSESELEFVARSGREVRFRAREPGEDLHRLASSVRFRGIVGVRVEGSEIVASLSAEDDAKSLEDSIPGLATGPFLESPLPFGDRLLFGSRHRGPPLELVAARLAAHWQLLVGGEVDVVAHGLDETQAAYLREFSDVTLRKIPSGAKYTLIANPSRTSVDERAVLGLMEDRRLPATLPERLPTILLRGDDRAVLSQFRQLSNQTWRRTGLRPSFELAPPEDFQERLVGADFDVVLTPIPADPSIFLPYFLSGEPFAKLGLASPEVEAAIRSKSWEVALDLLDEYLHQLEEFDTYVAYNAKWCGDQEPERNSWAWIAALRRCEGSL